jgi:hypothetical protein
MYRVNLFTLARNMHGLQKSECPSFEGSSCLSLGVSAAIAMRPLVLRNSIIFIFLTVAKVTHRHPANAQLTFNQQSRTTKDVRTSSCPRRQ